MAVNSKGLWVGCPIVCASDEHRFIVRVLRAQGHPPTAHAFLSLSNLARRDLTVALTWGPRPFFTFSHFRPVLYFKARAGRLSERNQSAVG